MARKVCTEIISNELLESAYVSKLPQSTIIFGKELLRQASDFASKHGFDLSKVHLAKDPDTTEFHLDVVQSAGRWCVFWGGHNHWLEAYW
jgi:hypothetical protein